MSLTKNVLGNRWVIVIAAGAIMGAALGVRHVQGLFLQPVILTQGWSREAFGFALAVQNLVWGVAQPLTGMLADRFGSAKVLFLGLLAYALGLLWMAGACDPRTFALSNGVLIGVALSGTAFAAVYGALSRIFADAQRAAVTLCMLMLALAPLAACLRDSTTRQVPGHLHAAPMPLSEAIRQAFGHRGFWLLNLGFMACGFQLAFIATHLPAYLIEHGLACSRQAPRSPSSRWPMFWVRMSVHGLATDGRQGRCCLCSTR